MSRRIVNLWARCDSDALVALAVAAGSMLLLALTADQGFVRDEGYYFRAAQEYHAWFEQLWHNLLAGRLAESFSDGTLSRAFGYNTEHPGFVKILMGWTWRVAHDWLGLTSSATGYRLGSILLVSVGNAFLYLLGRRFFSRSTGLLAVVLLLLCPHVFYHSHLACFDGPIMALTVVTVYAFWRSLSTPIWIFGAALAWGLAISTKHNAVFLLPTLVLAVLLARVGELRWQEGWIRLPRLPMSLFAMLLIGPLVFFVTYPFGWHDPIGRIGAYYSYHLHHEHYPVDYFGTLYSEPPFPVHFPFVMTALTVPLLILAPGIIGLASVAWSAMRGTWASLRSRSVGPAQAREWLLVLNTLIPPVVIALPTVPIFGGTKHWMTMMPFFCLLAAWIWGRGIEPLVRVSSWPRLTAGIAVTVLLAMPVYETVRTHPLGHTYFNEIALGHQGGAALGMPRTFWGGDARELLPQLNELAERGAAVFTDRMNYDDFRAYQQDGLLRPDLRWVGSVRHASWALINHQREYLTHELRIWASTKDSRPIAVVAFDGVPIASLYRTR